MREYIVRGKPIPQGRPRAYRRGTFIGFYDPSTSKKWKDEIAAQVKGQFPILHPGGPVSLSLFFKMPAPKSYKGGPHVCRPDVDNLAKAVKDALTGICWQDDCQIITLHARKAYCRPEESGVIIWVSYAETAD